jgi:hypothetical protein
MIITLDQVNLLKKALGISELILQVKKEWGSDVLLHGEKIKESLKETLLHFKGVGHSSISHATGAGGYAYLPELNYQIGFDVELRSRVRPALVNRICKNKDELLAARLPENLWVAKESAFKALQGETQPKVISEIEIDHWTMHDQNIETFFIKNPAQYGFSVARGVVLINDDFSVGLFICKK